MKEIEKEKQLLFKCPRILELAVKNALSIGSSKSK